MLKGYRREERHRVGVAARATAPGTAVLATAGFLRCVWQRDGEVHYLIITRWQHNLTPLLGQLGTVSRDFK
jgi:hypothetical protein